MVLNYTFVGYSIRQQGPLNFVWHSESIGFRAVSTAAVLSFKVHFMMSIG